MRKSRFTGERIAAILAEPERDEKTDEVCRRHGIGQNRFYKWMAKFGGMDVSGARRLKALGPIVRWVGSGLKRSGSGVRILRMNSQAREPVQAVAAACRIVGVREGGAAGLELWSWLSQAMALHGRALERPAHVRRQLSWTLAF